MENLSLFDQQEDIELSTSGLLNNKSLDVVKMEFLEAETMSWRDMVNLAIYLK